MICLSSTDYLVDEGTECNSTSDLLLERSREKSLVDLLIPLLVLLITLLKKLQEAQEQHRNTKLMNALLRLHREVSPKLAACAADLSSSYPDAALGFGAVCNLLVSALACWPIYGWTPAFFILSLQCSSYFISGLGSKGNLQFAMYFGMQNDLFPEEGVWLWKNGMPLLSAVRTLAVGTLLGPQKEREVNWYLHPGHPEVLLNQLTPQLDKISQVILHYAMTSLVVIQDMLRVFIIRIACQKADNASLLLQPIMSWIRMRLSESSCQTDVDAYKIYRLLDFLACLLEHPRAKPLLLKEGAIQMLIKALERCVDATESDVKQLSDGRNSAKCSLTAFSWCLPLCKSLSLICDSHMSRHYIGNYAK
ncbi:hypothetical protein CK203_070196 [Vitis vinifera]|uniref:Uncharacterized protein n=1 Tax=Vitis vinifera TaxID=29760 RepID=A0A438EHI5_VITVI|nr:hypothetical protein CK203_070196 [Vitis vinifera]